MPHWVTDFGLVVFAALSVLLTWLSNRSATSEMRGAASQRLTAVEGDVSELKQDQDKQWTVISQTGERVARLEGTRPNGGGFRV